MTRPWVIYTLIDPRSPAEIRYVGKTHQKPGKRLKRHLRDAKGTKNKTHCCRWLRGLLAAGVRPLLTVVEQGTVAWEEAEIRWVSKLREEGHPLTNITNGGEGTSGWSPSNDFREQKRAHMTRLWAECPEKMRASQREAMKDPEVREKLRLKALERQATPEIVAKQSEAQRRRWADPEARARAEAGLKKAASDPARRAAASARAKALWADPAKRAARIVALTGVKKKRIVPANS